MKTVECKADLHNHLAETARSIPTKFNKVVDYASKRLGDYGILGITSSKSDGRYRQFAHLDGYDRKDLGNAVYVPEKKLWIINTDEVHTRDGHLLTVGSWEDEVFGQGDSFYDSLSRVKSKGVINILPHPEAALGCIGALKKRIAIEWVTKEVNSFCFPTNLSRHVSAGEWNAQLGLWIPFIIPYGANDKFIEFYRDNIARQTAHALDRPSEDRGDKKKPSAKIGIVAFSDGHTIGEIGTSYTNLKMPYPEDIKDGEDFVWHLDGALRSSQLEDRLDKDGNTIERFVDFNGRMRYARWGTFKHCFKSAGLTLLGMK